MYAAFIFDNKRSKYRHIIERRKFNCWTFNAPFFSMTAGHSEKDEKQHRNVQQFNFIIFCL